MNKQKKSSSKKCESKDEFKVNYIFKENGLSFMNYIEENFKRYIENFK